ncbi:TnsD family Tn7-like transposition protein [Colwellia sp. Bg11-28]|uniref:TnsD family Tn7-like transposition protein n=1 Tax=Colwellia sp. Bg11-28 TaxID=2058305 RepID=UPI000C33859A|nr:TnsD family Tn7-like transposition protein [Colwellia sp. Bg11-28]PKH88313.1 hypothetical protein CXF79_05995 [Colwellia sp. Bg11-28]
MQLPTTYPDETLFSRYVRHMTILGMKEKNYLKLLFKRPRASIHPYLTIGITKASQMSAESASEIYAQQTLGRLFSYFLPHRATDIYKALLSDDGNAVIRACQLVSFKESEVLSLKYCPVCAKEDMRCYGVSYWHLIHQVPGVEACPSHKVWLTHQVLPERPHVKLHLLPTTSGEAQTCSELSYEIAKFASAFLRRIAVTNESFDQNHLITKIRECGYTHGKQRFKRIELTSDLFNFIKELKHSDPNLLPYSEADYRYLSYLLSGQVSQHPFKYLLVDFWLNNTCKNIPNPINEISHGEPSVAQQKIKSSCIKLLKQEKSLAEISRLTGKSRCYLKALAMKENIPIIIKPRIITDKVINIILALGYKGFHRKAIAKRFHISTGSVEQVISSESGLVQRRRRYKFESKRRRYKTQILRALQQKPSAIKQEIKASCYAAFHWLYAHEKVWLNSTLPSATKPIVRSKINWEKRDIELAPKVSTIMHNINCAISSTKLDKAIGGHGWLIHMQHKLPITMAVLHESKNIKQLSFLVG